MNIIHETILEIDLNKLANNFNYLKSKLKPDTKIIAVVKAYAYGHGDIAIASSLEKLGAHALWVADFEEGTRIRQSGIKIPIIIANPGKKSTQQIIDNKLDIVIYNSELLHLYGKLDKEIRIHIKFNSGMNRYGFESSELDELLSNLQKYPKLKIQSICSHLAASDNSTEDSFTNTQFQVFEKISSSFSKGINQLVYRHILNTNGVLRFPNKEYEMVRLGIGLYGVGNDDNLQHVSTLKSVISQVRIIKKGSKIGYDASFLAKEDMRIGVVPFGYADGLNRKLSTKNGVIVVQNIGCPIIGKISMDSCMINLKGTTAKTGDEVVIFGEENTILSIANKLITIPYEIFSSLNRRIKRIYSC
jgi:Alr-MurF fusion protein